MLNLCIFKLLSLLTPCANFATPQLEFHAMVAFLVLGVPAERQLLTPMILVQTLYCCKAALDASSHMGTGGKLRNPIIE